MADERIEHAWIDGSEQDVDGLREKIKYWSAHASDQTEEGKDCAALMKAVEFMRKRIAPEHGMDLAARLRDDAPDRMSADEFRRGVLFADDLDQDGDVRNIVNSERLMALRGGSEMDEDAIARFAAMCVAAERDRYGLSAAARSGAFAGVPDGKILDWICTNEEPAVDDSQKRNPDDAPPIEEDTDLGPGSRGKKKAPEGGGRNGGEPEHGREPGDGPRPVDGAAFDGLGLPPDELRKQIEYWESMKDEDTDEGRLCSAAMDALEFGRVRIKGARLDERTAPGADQKMRPGRFKACVVNEYESGPGKGSLRDFLNSGPLVKKRGRKLSDDEVAAWAAAAAVAERDRYSVPDSVSDADLLGMTAPSGGQAARQASGAGASQASEAGTPQDGGQDARESGRSGRERRNRVQGSPLHNMNTGQIMDLAEGGYLDVSTAKGYMVVHTVLDIMERNMRAYRSDPVTDYLLRPGSSFEERKVARQLKKTNLEYAKAIADIRKSNLSIEKSVARVARISAGYGADPASPEDQGGDRPKHGLMSGLRNRVEGAVENAAARARNKPPESGTFTRNMPGKAGDVGAGVRDGISKAAAENGAGRDPSPEDAEAVYADAVSATPGGSRTPLHRKFGQFFSGMRERASAAREQARAAEKDEHAGDGHGQPEPKAPDETSVEERYDEDARADAVYGEFGEDLYDETPYGGDEPSAEDFYDEDEKEEKSAAAPEPEERQEERSEPEHVERAGPEPVPREPEPVPAQKPALLSGEELYEFAARNLSGMSEAAARGEEATSKAAAATDEIQERLAAEAGMTAAQRTETAVEIAEAAAAKQPVEQEPKRSGAMQEAFARMAAWKKGPGPDGKSGGHDIPGT